MFLMRVEWAARLKVRTFMEGRTETRKYYFF
jgi:hypothetical protein